MLQEKRTENENENSEDAKIVRAVFVSLLLDLLAFTMILPLLPALLDHYEKQDNNQGLYSTILSYIQSIQVYLNVPARFNSVLFGGEISLIPFL